MFSPYGQLYSEWPQHTKSIPIRKFPFVFSPCDQLHSDWPQHTKSIQFCELLCFHTMWHAPLWRTPAHQGNSDPWVLTSWNTTGLSRHDRMSWVLKWELIKFVYLKKWVWPPKAWQNKGNLEVRTNKCLTYLNGIVLLGLHTIRWAKKGQTQHRFSLLGKSWSSYGLTE